MKAVDDKVRCKEIVLVCGKFFMSGGFVHLKHYISLDQRIYDLAQHKDGVRISFYNRKKERPVNGQLQRDTFFLCLVLRFCSFL